MVLRRQAVSETGFMVSSLRPQKGSALNPAETWKSGGRIHLNHLIFFRLNAAKLQLQRHTELNCRTSVTRGGDASLHLRLLPLTQGEGLLRLIKNGFHLATERTVCLGVWGFLSALKHLEKQSAVNKQQRLAATR